MALESMTLPSRLRPDQSKRGLLGDMETALNVNGNQRIASLQCSILKATKPNGSDAPLSPAPNDQRLPGSNTRNLAREDDPQEANASFDMDLSCGETTRSAYPSAYDKAKEHIFARVENLRDSATQASDANGEDDRLARKRRRLAGVSIVQKSVRCYYPLGCEIMGTSAFAEFCMQNRALYICTYS